MDPVAAIFEFILKCRGIIMFFFVAKKSRSFKFRILRFMHSLAFCRGILLLTGVGPLSSSSTWADVRLKLLRFIVNSLHENIVRV